MEAAAVDEEAVPMIWLAAGTSTGYRPGMIRTLLACLVVLSASAATAAPMTMQCTHLMRTENGPERVQASYRMVFDADANRFDLASVQGKEPLPDQLTPWQVLFVSKDRMRVVAAVRKDVPEESFLPPVEFVHADFARTTFEMRGIGAGETLDVTGFVEIPTTNRMECRRLD